MHPRVRDGGIRRRGPTPARVGIEDIDREDAVFGAIDVAAVDAMVTPIAREQVVPERRRADDGSPRRSISPNAGTEVDPPEDLPAVALERDGNLHAPDGSTGVASGADRTVVNGCELTDPAMTAFAGPP